MMSQYSKYSRQCKTEAVSIIVIGSIAAVLLAISKATIIDYYEKSFDAMIFFTWLAIGGVFVEFFSAVLFAMSELLERAAEISYTNAKLNGNKKEEIGNISAGYQNNNSLSDGSWKCDQCRRVNAKYISTCVCGNSRPNR